MIGDYGWQHRAALRTKTYEGYRGMPYKDHKGHDTIGCGTKLPLSEEQSVMLLKDDQDTFLSELMQSPRGGTFYGAPDDIKIALVDMLYHMGCPNLLTFERMWDALDAGDHEKAADEVMDSDYARDPRLTNRAKDNADMIRGTPSNRGTI